jgi:hypothetical protein
MPGASGVGGMRRRHFAACGSALCVDSSCARCAPGEAGPSGSLGIIERDPSTQRSCMPARQTTEPAVTEDRAQRPRACGVRAVDMKNVAAGKTGEGDAALPATSTSSRGVDRSCTDPLGRVRDVLVSFDHVRGEAPTKRRCVPARQMTDTPLAPELEAIATAAADRLRAEAEGKHHQPRRAAAPGRPSSQRRDRCGSRARRDRRRRARRPGARSRRAWP